MAANIEVARQAEAPGAAISRVPGGTWQPRQANRQQEVILIVILLSAAANLAANLAPVALFAIVLAASRGLVRDSQVIPRTLTWYFGSVPDGAARRRSGVKNGGGTARDVVFPVAGPRPRVSLTPGSGTSEAPLIVL